MIRKTGGKGPGGCHGEAACDAYCEGGDHMLECMEFALEYDLVPAAEAQEMRGAMKALRAGAKMPACRSKAACDSYCQEPENAAECMEFALAAGFMSEEEAQMAKRMMERGLIGKSPGGCRGEAECDAYCQDSAHIEECIDFSVAAGFMSAEEGARVKKMGAMGGPGGCRGDECESYCNDPSHADECLSFAVESGRMSAEEAAKIRSDLEAGHRPGEQGGGVGPGGCASQAECESYCQNPIHADECLAISVQSGRMTFEEAQKIRDDLRAGHRPGE